MIGNNASFLLPCQMTFAPAALAVSRSGASVVSGVTDGGSLLQLLNASKTRDIACNCAGFLTIKIFVDPSSLLQASGWRPNDDFIARMLQITNNILKPFRLWTACKPVASAPAGVVRIRDSFLVSTLYAPYEVIDMLPAIFTDEQGWQRFGVGGRLSGFATLSSAARFPLVSPAARSSPQTRPFMTVGTYWLLIGCPITRSF